MRFIRPALVLALALVPGAAASAEPFDGAEKNGTKCLAEVLRETVPYPYGVLSGGAYVVADLLATENGILKVDPNPGPVEGVELTCSIRKSSVTYATVTRTSTSGVVVVEPQITAFHAPSDGVFEVCTTVRWTDSEGARLWEVCQDLPGGGY